MKVLLGIANIASVLVVFLGMLTFIVGLLKYLFIFPKGAFKIIQYPRKDYFAPDEKPRAKRAVLIMISGIAMTVTGSLILWSLKF